MYMVLNGHRFIRLLWAKLSSESSPYSPIHHDLADLCLENTRHFLTSAVDMTSFFPDLIIGYVQPYLSLLDTSASKSVKLAVTL